MKHDSLAILKPSTDHLPKSGTTLLVGFLLPLGLLVAGCSGTATLPPPGHTADTTSEGDALADYEDASATPRDSEAGSSPSDTEAAPPGCTEDADCGQEGLTPCKVSLCDVTTGACVTSDLPDGDACDDGDPCTIGASCEAGTCTGGPPAPANCDALECGLDLCGNECGACDPGVTCNDGQCGTAEPDPSGFSCDTVSFEGCCTAEGTLVWCDNSTIETLECSENPSCGWSVEEAFFDCGADGELPDPAGSSPYLCPGETCTTSCADMECGYACGEACGTCGEGSVCQAGACVTCSCDGATCGTNQCGESCGECAEGTFCSEASGCLECSCDGLSCGADPCGNSCGSCDAGQACSEGACIEDPCEGVSYEGCCDGDTLQYCDNGTLMSLNCQSSPSCGWKAEANYYDCGSDGAEEPTGASPILCPNVCYPTCADENACGDDGCGGSCGDCGDNQACSDAGLCEQSDPCEGIDCGAGTCDATSGAAACDCTDTGFEGDNCEANIDDCAAEPCQNGGTCNDGVGTFTCECTAGFDGDTCQNDIDDCADEPCQNGGTCNDGVGAYTCDCTGTVFTGTNCEAPTFTCDPTWAGCTKADFDANDMTDVAGVIPVTLLSTYTPTCVRVSVGQTVEVDATNGFPFEAQCGEDGAMEDLEILTNPVTITVTSPGYYNYKSANHDDILGNIEVVQ